MTNEEVWLTALDGGRMGRRFACLTGQGKRGKNGQVPVFNERRHYLW